VNLELFALADTLLSKQKPYCMSAWMLGISGVF